MRTHRRNYRVRRSLTPVPVVALVGYTNAGKSTLLNTLTQAGVLAEDKLFATLDPTTRRIRLKCVVSWTHGRHHGWARLCRPPPHPCLPRPLTHNCLSRPPAHPCLCFPFHSLCFPFQGKQGAPHE